MASDATPTGAGALKLLELELPEAVNAKVGGGERGGEKEGECSSVL